MIREFKPSDADDLADLLEWVDNHPDHEAFAPDAHDIDDLAIEAEAQAAFVEENSLGEVVSYAGLISYRDIWVLEGPIFHDADPERVLKATVEYARKHHPRVIYAFVGNDNKDTRRVLDEIGFKAFQFTTFYILERKKAKLNELTLPEDIQILDYNKVNFHSISQ